MNRNRTTRPTQTRRRGFTLVELMVVISIIVLIAGTALPSIIAIFHSGSEAQAYNALRGMLTAARALAIQRATYTAVHVQRADTSQPYLANLHDAFFAAVMIRDKSTGLFKLTEGYTPRRLPGTAAIGEISDEFVDFSSGAYQNLGDVDDFTTLSIVFSPHGSVVKYVGGENIQFDANDKIFRNAIPGVDKTMLWDDRLANDYGSGEPGVTAVVIFDYAKFKSMTPGARAAYLAQRARLVPINIHTGQLFER